MSLLAIAFGLGLTGLDPIGALLALTALARGARRTSVLLFALIVFGVTALLGAMLSLTIGAGVTTLLAQLPAYIWVTFYAITAVLLLWWAASRWRRRSILGQSKDSRLTRWLDRGLPLVGLLFALSAVTDPSFVALVVIAGNEHSVLLVLFAHTVWSIVGQLPLLLLAIAVACNGHIVFQRRFNGFWERIGPHVSLFVTVLIGLIGVFLVLNVAAYLVWGKFIFG